MPERIDLGSHLWNTTIPVELIFVNQSSETITVQKVVSSCDCLVIDGKQLTGRAITPNETLQLSAAIDTGKHPGSLVRTVTLTSDQGGEWVARLDFEVFGSWTVSPARLDFGEFRLGTPGVEYLEKSFTFKSDADELIGDLKCNASWLQWFIAPRGAGIKEILVRIPVDRLPPGVGTAEIVFQTTSAVRPTSVVHVRVNALPALIVRPPSVFLVGGEPRRVEIFDPEGKPVELIEAEASNRFVATQLVDRNGIEIQNTSGQAIQEAVSVRAKDALGRFITIRISAF